MELEKITWNFLVSKSIQVIFVLCLMFVEYLPCIFPGYGGA